MTGYRVFRGDCLDVMARLIEQGERFHAVACDPPYALSFMGKAWDKATPRDFEEWLGPHVVPGQARPSGQYGFGRRPAPGPGG